MLNCERVLGYTLTKRMAEELAKYSQPKSILDAVIYPDVDTLERIESCNLRIF
jgi:excinuclease UvrABC helicase subunit UvrB